MAFRNRPVHYLPVTKRSMIECEKTPMYDVVREKIHLRGLGGTTKLYSRTRVDR